METPPIKTRAQIEEFADILQSAGIKPPPNVEIVVKLNPTECREIYSHVIHDDFPIGAKLVYISRTGVPFNIQKDELSKL